MHRYPKLLVPALLTALTALVIPSPLPAAPVPASEIDATLRDAVEFTARSGLPNVFAKLQRGAAVKVAYLGGSITAQNGWRIQSREWLQKQFPKAQLSEIHAAIGGTGSDLGVFRVEADALKDKPDLLFVEFAVNDANAAPAQIAKAMEGIVRKTWCLLPTTDICFIYTLTAKDTAALAAGKMKRSDSVMETVADHYGIPSIHFGLEVARLEKEGKLITKSDNAPMTRVSGDELNTSAPIPTDAQGRILFSKDGVHPYPETGHVLYTQALIRSFEKMQTLGTPGAHALIAPLTSDNWEGARQLPLDQGGVLTGKVTKLDPKTDSPAKSFVARMPSMWKFEPGATLSFKFKGTKASIYDLLGPDGAQLEFSVDGKLRQVARFDGYCTYQRLGTLSLADNLPDTVHEVTITVLAEAPDKAKILFDRNRADLEKNPAKYAPTNWYAGAIFIVGEIVK
ncbi:MAG: GDSL-type esterase/lipase family protein [Opitutaceae bacterium]|jgi:hypothetical protein